jgi:hypothetical protein
MCAQRSCEPVESLAQSVVGHPEPSRVPCTGVLGGDLEHPRTVTSDEDRDPPRRLGEQLSILSCVKATVEGDALAVEEFVEDLNCLFEARGAVIGGIAERLELGVARAGTKA